MIDIDAAGRRDAMRRDAHRQVPAVAKHDLQISKSEVSQPSLLHHHLQPQKITVRSFGALFTALSRRCNHNVRRIALCRYYWCHPASFTCPPLTYYILLDPSTTHYAPQDTCPRRRCSPPPRGAQRRWHIIVGLVSSHCPSCVRLRGRPSHVLVVGFFLVLLRRGQPGNACRLSGPAPGTGHHGFPIGAGPDAHPPRPATATHLQDLLLSETNQEPLGQGRPGLCGRSGGAAPGGKFGVQRGVPTGTGISASDDRGIRHQVGAHQLCGGRCRHGHGGEADCRPAFGQRRADAREADRGVAVCLRYTLQCLLPVPRHGVRCPVLPAAHCSGNQCHEPHHQQHTVCCGLQLVLLHNSFGISRYVHRKLVIAANRSGIDIFQTANTCTDSHCLSISLPIIPQRFRSCPTPRYFSFPLRRWPFCTYSILLGIPLVSVLTDRELWHISILSSRVILDLYAKI
jgi:hypothetical protein